MAKTNRDKQELLAYYNGLRRGLYDSIIVLAVPGEGDDVMRQRSLLLGSDTLSEWTTVFTHKSFDPNDNYDQKEYLGDKLLAAAYANFLIKKHKHITEAQLTNLNTQQLKKSEQSKMFDTWNLEEYIRSNFPITVSIKEDIMEAIIGVLFILGERKLGEGFILLENLVGSLYSHIVSSSFMLAEESSKNSKQVLKEIVDKYDWWGKLANENKNINKLFTSYRNGASFINNTDKTRSKKGVIMSYRIPEKMKIYLLQEGLISGGDNLRLVEVKANNFSSAEDIIAEKTLEILKRRFKITYETAKKISIAYEDKLQQRMRDDGIITLDYIDNYSKKYNTNPTHMMLIGIDEAGNKQILSHVNTLNDVPVQASILKHYLRNNYKKVGKYNNSIITIDIHSS